MNPLNILGLEIELKEWDKKKKLPIYINSQFFIKKAIISGIECLALLPQKELPPITTLKKQITKIQEVENVPVYLDLDKLSYFRKENLLQNKIPFILKDKMIYLPFMATVLTNEQITPYNNQKLTLAAQLLFIWILYQDSNQYYIHDALKTLNFSNMTLTRAYRQLVATSLFSEGKVGRHIILSTNLNKKELYQAMTPYLQSPFKKQGYIFKEELNEHMVHAGDSLLSEYTFISPPQINVYAIDKSKSKNLKIHQELVDRNQQILIQLWNYNPLLFSKDKKHIDSISLITSYLDNQDERIEIELDHLLDETLKIRGEI